MLFLSSVLPLETPSRCWRRLVDAGSDGAVLQHTPNARRHTSPHILNGEHQMRVRTGLVLLKPGKQQLTCRLAPHAARARHDHLHFEFILVCFPSQKKQFKNYVHLHLQRFGRSPLSIVAADRRSRMVG